MFLSFCQWLLSRCKDSFWVVFFFLNLIGWYSHRQHKTLASSWLFPRGKSLPSPHLQPWRDVTSKSPMRRQPSVPCLFTWHLPKCLCTPLNKTDQAHNILFTFSFVCFIVDLFVFGWPISFQVIVLFMKDLEDLQYSMLLSNTLLIKQGTVISKTGNKQFFKKKTTSVFLT